MTSRITRATVTVVSFTGLVLLGVFICALNAGRANAQRVNESTEFPTPVEPSQPTVAFRNDQTPRLNRQPYGASSAILMQPIVVAIKEGPQLRGEPVELGALPIKTIFGSVSIPINQIAGVRTADDSRQPATICLSNGDSLTGELSMDSITIKTGWGSATIARDHIVSIVTVAEPVTWQQHEGRWRMTPVEAVTRSADAVEAKEDVGKIPASAETTQLDSSTLSNPRPIETIPAQVVEPSSK